MNEAVSKILKEIAERPPARTLSEKREAFAFLCSFSGEPSRVPWRADEVSGVPVRIYNPEGRVTLIWFHGGGYVCGSLETHHAAMTQIASLTRARIVNVGYRLAPEHKYPSAFEDGLRVVASCEGPIVVGGDSAGGNLAAALCLSRDVRVEAQILLYPTLDAYFRAETWSTEPVTTIANKKDSREFDVLYARTENDFADPLFSPIEARNFSGLPPAHIFLAQHDPARGDGELYAEKLGKADVRVFPDAVHGFLTMAEHLESSRNLHRAIAEVLNRF